MVCILLVIGLLPLYAGMHAMRALYWEYSFEKRVEQMKEQGTALAGQIAQTGYLQQQMQPEVSARLSVLANLMNGRIILLNSNLQVVKDTAEREEGKTLISEEPIYAMQGEIQTYYNEKERKAEVILPIVVGANAENNGQVIGVMIFEGSLADIVSAQELFRENIVVLMIGAAILLLGAALVISWCMIKPLRTLSGQIEHAAETYEGTEMIKSTGYLEVEQIAEAFRGMMEKTVATEKSRQEFVSNVSHELKTPLTAIKVLSDSLVLEPDVPIEMYREFINDINSEIDREAKIVNDLLALVKLDKTSGEMHIAEVNINELLEIILKRLKPLALKRGIEMIFESYRTVLAEIDEVKMSLVFTNLIENAIKYNRDGGRVMVSLNADHRYFYAKIEDTGIGIPEEEQGLIFDRFYRVDKARSRETGGTGLGLSITKSAVQMHKGSIKVQSIPGVGSIFTVRIPLSYVLTVQ
ncbi:MAG: HAMP domain-containing sensor histidine kinase [Lachnospiraceae bacterium]|nr:HAMP domain-containing sensor histidine kinase [Lachnospiraceae bacterium]